MFLKNLKNNKNLFLITLLYFALGFININFGVLALLCMLIPLITLFYTGKKTWCQGYCPRSTLFVTATKGRTGGPTPKTFIKGKFKWIVLGYFTLSLLIIIFSTIAVAAHKIAPMNYPRLLILIPLPHMFQLISFEFTPWFTHMSYRFYSMMLTTTIFGMILAFVYKPRTWCTICPIMTISDIYTKK